MKLFITLCLLTALTARAQTTAPTSQPTTPAWQPVDYLKVDQPRDWVFPRDHGRHDGYKLEWWYFTGQMHDHSNHRLGYQLTFFRSAMQPTATPRQSAMAVSDIYFAHAAISDIDNKQFLFKDRIERGQPKLAFAQPDRLDVHLLDWDAVFKTDGIHLNCSEKDLKIDLLAKPGRGPILQGPGGVNIKSNQAGHASYYYSMTRLPTSGTLTINGNAYTVDGLSWMDHEFSTAAMAADQVGWDWMSISLNDGSDLMIYRLRKATGQTDYLSGTRISADGSIQYLTGDQIQLSPGDIWVSPLTKGRYPQQWDIKITGQAPMRLHTAFNGQELITTASTSVNYMEAVSEVTDEKGKPIGQGYLEMTGYAK